MPAWTSHRCINQSLTRTISFLSSPRNFTFSSEAFWSNSGASSPASTDKCDAHPDTWDISAMWRSQKIASFSSSGGEPRSDRATEVHAAIFFAAPCVPMSSSLLISTTSDVVFDDALGEKIQPADLRRTRHLTLELFPSATYVLPAWSKCFCCEVCCA